MDLPRVVERIEIRLGDELVFRYDRGEQDSWAAMRAAAGDAVADAAAKPTTPSCQ